MLNDISSTVKSLVCAFLKIDVNQLASVAFITGGRNGCRGRTPVTERPTKTDQCLQLT